MVGWAWFTIAAIEGGYAVFLASWLFSAGGGQADWLTLLLSAGLAALTFAVGRRMLNARGRPDVLRSLALAGVYTVGFPAVAAAIPNSTQLSVTLAAVGLVLGFLSLWASRALLSDV